MKSVIQDWVSSLTMMQQSVLLASIRGPDGIQKYSAAKNMLRWYRRCILISSFDKEVLTTPMDVRGGSFTGPSVPVSDEPWQSAMDKVLDRYFVEMDAYPAHFTKHFMLSAEIVGYKHPDPDIRQWWNKTYVRLVRDLHLNPETQEQLDYRLGDKRDQWASGAETATMR